MEKYCNYSHLEKMLLQRMFISCGSDSKYLVTTTLLLNCKYAPRGTKKKITQHNYIFKNRNTPLLNKFRALKKPIT